MKKVFSVLLLSAMVIAMFTACSDSGEDNSSVQSVSSQANILSEEHTSSSAESATDKKYATIDEYVLDDDTYADVGKSISLGDDLTFVFNEVTEGGNKLVYEYNALSYMGDIGQELVDKTLESSEKYIKIVADEIVPNAAFDNPILVIRYLNYDDSVICEVQFDANGVVSKTPNKDSESSAE